MLNRPKILFLDEPTSGLDPSTAIEINKLMLEMKNDGTTFFLTTHNMAEASTSPTLWRYVFSLLIYQSGLGIMQTTKGSSERHLPFSVFVNTAVQARMRCIIFVYDDTRLLVHLTSQLSCVFFLSKLSMQRSKRRLMNQGFMQKHLTNQTQQELRTDKTLLSK